MLIAIIKEILGWVIAICFIAYFIFVTIFATNTIIRVLKEDKDWFNRFN